MFTPGILEGEQFVQGLYRPVFDVVVMASFLSVSCRPINVRVAGPGLSVPQHPGWAGP